MKKKVRIVLVSNSIPLPETDFLKHKVTGLSPYFDLHLACWGSNKDRKRFCNQYNVSPARIHLFYNKLNFAGKARLAVLNMLRLVFTPWVTLPLLSRLLKKSADLQELFLKFTHYYPLFRLKPDIVHFEYGTLAHRFSDIKYVLDCKTSVSFRGYDINYVGLEHPSYYQAVWKNMDAFHFLGNDLKNRAVKRGYSEGKTEVLIPPAIDTDFFAPANTEKEKIFTIVSVGRLTWKKGYEYGIRAIKLLKESSVVCRYNIYATGEHLQPLLFAIRELGLEEEVNIILSPTQADIRQALQKAHVFLHPAVSEGFSNAVLEAQSMQLPVVATDADGLAENIADGITGFVVPVYDSHALADKLEMLYRQPELRATMGKAGRQRVLQNFRGEEQVKKFVSFYSQLADAKD